MHLAHLRHQHGFCTSNELSCARLTSLKDRLAVAVPLHACRGLTPAVLGRPVGGRDTSSSSVHQVGKQVGRRQLLRMAATADEELAVQLATYAASQGTELPHRMNTIPHPREMRRFFYQDVCDGVRAGLEDGLTRMSVRLTVPETNVEMDVYRVGTILEMVRDLAASVVQDGKRVKVCVQQALGQGVFQGTPLSLSGVMRIMEAMDWGQAREFITFGNYGAKEVGDEDFYILISPQNVNGDSIIPFLEEMVTEVESQGKACVILNPRLDDIPSANGVMGVRGRGDRIQFASSFVPVYHFRLLYISGQFWPIQGALRYRHGQQWEVYKRFDTGARLGESEEYRLLALFDEQPNGGGITQAFEKARPRSDYG